MTIAYSAPLSPALAGILDAIPQTSPVVADEIRYERDGVEFGGFLASPEDDETHPGVLIVHDWSGLNDHTRVRAQMLARLGYVALAGDVYGGGRLFGPTEAGDEAARYYSDPDLFRARLAANLDRLRSQPGVDPERIAVIGYCFGGSAALEVARSGAAIAGAVSFHGRLDTARPATKGDITAPLLVLTGAADPYVPDDEVLALENELRAAEAPDWQVVSYSDAMHAFAMPDAASPEHGAAFQASANARSWTAMRAFFDEIFA
ncbi:MAG: dienelactone hydrolase family protein [Janthinobacterium lividum]